uniref:Uncharacterized protein n=1 Tax=Arundo donax TaxID=35708 RepID=A0A0A8ZVF2_ARUDO
MSTTTVPFDQKLLTTLQR